MFLARVRWAGALATRPTALLGACWVGRSSAGAGAGAAVSQAYASARSALKNASFQCIPGRPERIRPWASMR
jgi:hypothetical protein